MFLSLFVAIMLILMFALDSSEGVALALAIAIILGFVVNIVKAFMRYKHFLTQFPIYPNIQEAKAKVVRGGRDFTVDNT